MSVEGRDTAAATDVLLVEVHGRVGEHKIKKNSAVVDLADDDAGGPCPGWPRGCAACPSLPAPSRGEVHHPGRRQAEGAGRQGSQPAASPSRRPASARTPALDDELAKDTGEADTLEELKNKVSERLLDRTSSG